MNEIENVDEKVVRGFGEEWHRFDQGALSEEERLRMFEQYFAVFPWEKLPPMAEGFDAGCGTGRWARLVAPKVGRLHCIDPSEAIEVARRNLGDLPNCTFERSTIDGMTLADGSMDFGYSLGVLHHLPDPAGGLAACVRKLKPGAPFLIYIYYAFDNQPAWFRLLWRLSDCVRRMISRRTFAVRRRCADLIAILVYWPLARSAALLERCGMGVHSFPLSAYRHRSFYSMRTDSLDRFGTALEHRFSRREIEAMMVKAGLQDVRFSLGVPFWCAVGHRVSEAIG